MKALVISALVMIAGAGPAITKPGIFDPAIEKECILSWFELTPDNTTDDLAVAYFGADPQRLAAVLNICGDRAASTAKLCDVTCATEIQVRAEMYCRTGKPVSLGAVERLR